MPEMPERSSALKRTSWRRMLFAVRAATMVGAACFAVGGISETLGQEQEKIQVVHIAPEVIYTPETEAIRVIPPVEVAKETEPEESLEESIVFSKNDSYLLCKIAMAEAEGEGVKGKAMVMQVVLNRVQSAVFPDTVREVIYQKNQFSPVRSGRFDAVEPDAECYEALRLIREDHWDESQDALYFESKSASKWHRDHLEFLFRYGNHYFYR